MKQYKIILGLFGALAGCLFAGTAYAGMYILNPKAPVQSIAPMVSPPIFKGSTPRTFSDYTESKLMQWHGMSSPAPSVHAIKIEPKRVFFVEDILDKKNKPKVVTGFSSQSSLRMLFDQVAPSTWKFECSLGTCDKRFIRWRASRPVGWKVIMKGALNKAKLRFGIEYAFYRNTHTLKVSRKHGVLRDWRVDGKKTFTENIRKWAKYEGYKVMHNDAFDWETGVSQTLHGTFREVLERLVSAYAKRGVAVDVKLNEKLGVIDISKGNSLYQVGGK